MGSKKNPVGPALKSDDLIETFLDSRVTEAMAKALAPFISLSVSEAMDKKLANLMLTVRDLKADNVRLTGICNDISTENVNLRKVLADQEKRIDDLECYSRSENLIIKGLSESSAAERSTAATDLHSGVAALDTYQSVEGTVITFFRETLNVDIVPTDISIAHRVKAGPKDSVRPVIVRFTNRKARNLVYYAKKSLKSTRIFISEHLTKTSADLFFKARKLLREKKIHATWTQNGQVLVKFSSDPSTRATVIRSRADLRLQP